MREHGNGVDLDKAGGDVDAIAQRHIDRRKAPQHPAALPGRNALGGTSPQRLERLFQPPCLEAHHRRAAHPVLAQHDMLLGQHRKMLADLAVREKESFAELAKLAASKLTAAA